MKFTYSSGQQPLDGFTLKRGVGKGGFGEVYFAVSDGGKEVALKLLRNNQEVELRGVAQCLNLKHPNLVNLYDLRTDPRGDRWVVMEYVAGESLHTVLSRHPEGLPMELAREWFLALARAIAYLHDHGIVHRDLKPANVFLENGVVKVGDYGLSKSISGSQRTAQTQSIGTVHYMAPEISTGNYNKGIDVYAAGVILYEMLTGRVPFDGESAGEILMKHLTAPPDLSKVPRDFVPVLARALSKNPVQRYANMAEMAHAVEAVGVELPPPKPTPAARPLPPRQPDAAAPPPPPSTVGPVSPGALVGELCGSLVMAAVFAALATALWAALAQMRSVGDLGTVTGGGIGRRLLALAQMRSVGDLGTVFFLTVSASWAVLVPAKFWRKPIDDSWSRRGLMLILGALVGLAALWLDGWTSVPLSLPSQAATANADLAEGAAYLSYFALVFLALRWWKMTDRRRNQRFSFAPILATAFWALVLLLLWHHLKNGAVALVMASAIVQLVSPWEPPPPPATRRLRLRYA
jgi:eukaryotic-like serine/threonine-protein kinase